MAISKIRVLNDQTINKIAAGEVIENPASVIKELVENSLDAGATNICVEIQEGGRQLIRISDDGCGMSPDDAILSLERHATSKIRDVEDIEALLTMGFRGEAVPSIAAISKFTLLTCPRSEGEKKEEGTFIVVEGGRLISCSQAARSPGTTIEVKSLFFNVPVRRKFQKSPSFDTQEILKMLGHLALAYSNVHFELISDQKSILKTPLSSPHLSFHELLGKRLESILGKEYTSGLIPIEFEQGACKLTGYIGNPLSHKANKTGQLLFINQRLVSSPLIGWSVREGYGTMLPNNRYPVFVLHLHLPGDLLDVNVHPQKKEVRLRQENQLKETIIQGVQAALRQEQQHMHPFSIEEEMPTPPFWGAYASLLSPSSKTLSVSEEKWEFKASSPENTLSSCFQDSTETFKGINPLDFSHAQSTPQPQSHPPLPIETPSLNLVSEIPRIAATLVGYCVIESFKLPHQLIGCSGGKQEGGLLLLDQRAAYSRIYYEKLLKHRSSKESQQLLIPLTLQLSTLEFQTLSKYAPVLNEMGFGLREFGENVFLVDAFPLFLKEDQLLPCLNDLIQDLVEAQTSRRIQMEQEEQLALAACRASLPTTKRLSVEEAQGLLRQLLSCDIPAQCPFGKPTCLYFSPEDLAKLFQKTIKL